MVGWYSFRTHLILFGQRQECRERLQLVGRQRALLAVAHGDDRAAAVLLFDLLRGLLFREEKKKKKA